jgi:hypothetical protein
MWNSEDEVEQRLRIEVQREDEVPQTVLVRWEEAPEGGAVYLFHNARLCLFRRGKVHLVRRDLGARAGEGPPWKRFPSLPRRTRWGYFLSLPIGITPQRTWTLAAWIRPETPPGHLDFGSIRVLYADTGGVLFALRPDGRLHLHVLEAGQSWTTSPSLTSRIRIEPNRWTHVAGTSDGRRIRLYINGSLAGETLCQASVHSQTAAIGCNPYGDRSGFFLGLVDEVKLYARALTGEEIRREAQERSIPSHLPGGDIRPSGRGRERFIVGGANRG